jgi:zinc protease
MKKSIRVLAILGLMSVAAVGQPAKSYKDLKFPPLRTIPAPKAERFVLANGMTVFLVEDHELPTFGGVAMIRAGNRYVPQDKAGLAGIVGQVMRSGGSTTRKGEQIDELLDRKGATVETGIGLDSGTLSMSSLKEDIDLVLPIAAELLRNPAFPQDKIDLAKTQLRDGISRRNEQSGAILSREFNKLIYGKDSPFTRQAEYATVNAITREDLVNFHKQYFQPENVILGIYGDFNAAEMRAKIEKHFGAWPKGNNPKPPIPTVAAAKPGGLYVINRDDVNQSEIRLGTLGGKLSDKDFASNLVLSSILGGGFSSRLFNRIRTKEGYAYSSYAAWAPSYDRPGTYFAGAGTKSESTAAAIEAIREEITKMSQGEVTDRELQSAKDEILKGQAFDFDSTAKVVNRMVTYEYFGYPQDFLQQTQEAVRRVTKADVAAAAKQYWQADKLTVLVVGKTADFGAPLKGAQPIDITIPQPEAPKVSEATPDSLNKGKALLAKMAQAHGAEKVAGLKSYTLKGTTTMNTPGGPVSLPSETSHRMPSQFAQKLTTPMGEMLMVYDGQKMWMKSPQGVQDAPAAMAADTKEQLFRDTVHLLVAAPTLTAQSLGASKAGDKAAEAVLVTDPQTKFQVTLLLDPQSGMLLGKRYNSKLSGGAETEEIYTDYKDFGGVKLPASTVVMQNGQKRAESKLEAATFGTAVPDSLFVKQ